MSKTRLWTLLVLVVGLMVALVAAGCGGDEDDDGDDGPAATETEPATEDLGLINEGRLLVGTDAPFPPFEIGRPGSANFGGYDIDVMDAIAESLGVEIEYVNSSFDTIFRDVAQGQFDIVAAASTITPGRERTVDFSDPYYEAQQALIVTEDSEIASVADLAGAEVGAQDATTGEAYANEETEAADVLGFPQGPDAIAALQTGQVEAVIIDQPVAVDALEKNENLVIAEEIPTEELYGFAMSPDNEALRLAVNEALSALKEDGTIESLYAEYFDAEPPASVLEGTHEPS